MFAKTIVESARFLKMPPTSQNLYFHLGMNADDDGVVEAYSTMKMLGNTEDDLRVLISKGFVRILNEDLVTLIMDWHENNLIKGDRYKPSVYKDLILSLEPWNQIGTTLEPQVKLSKDKLSKDNIKHKYGVYNNVLLTDEQLEKLKSEFSNWEDWIQRVDDYVQSTGKHYKDYLAVIRTWSKKQQPIKKEKVEAVPVYDAGSNDFLSSLSYDEIMKGRN